MDAQRKKQYTSQPFLCNGKEVHFPYQVEAKEPLDVLFIATKFGGFSQAIEQIHPFVGENTILCSCLNGISSEDLLQEAYPENTIVRTIVQGMDSTYLNQSVTYHLLGEIVFGAKRKKKKKPVINWKPCSNKPKSHIGALQISCASNGINSCSIVA